MLEDNHQFLQIFFDHAEAGVAVWDLNFRYLIVNRSECARLGMSREDVQGKRLSDLMPPERAALYCDNSAESMRRGVDFEEYSCINGKERYHRVYLFSLSDAAGVVYGVGSITRDITEHKMVELASKANKLEFEHVLQHVPLTVCYLDNTFHYRFVNDSYAAWYGMKKEEIEGRNIQDVLGGNRFERVRVPILAAMQGQTMCFDNAVTDSNGVEYVMTAYYIPHFGPDRELLGIVAMGVDITERKRVELEMRKQEKLLRDIQDAIQDGVAVTDTEFRIVSVNKSIAKNYGDGSLLVGKRCFEVFHQRDSICPDCIGLKVLQTGKAQTLEREYFLPSGGTGWLELYAYPMIDDQGIFTGIVSYFRDVTEKKRLMSEAVRAGQLACVGELAASVAHEVNNPIMGMINYAQVLLDRKHLQGDGPEVLGRIIGEGERIKQIVHNLLFFARDLKQAHGPVRIMDALQGALDLIRSQLKRDHIALVCDIPESLPLVWGGDRELRQVFLNLVSNARYAVNRRHHTPPDKKTLRIWAETINKDNKDYVRLYFWDNGTGIPEDVRTRIFDSFFTTKPEGEGTGLGLSISSDIVREHGGTMRALSELNSHTLIIVELPTAAAW